MSNKDVTSTILARSRVVLQNIDALHSAARRAATDSAYSNAYPNDTRANATLKGSIAGMVQVARLVLSQLDALPHEVRRAHIDAGDTATAETRATTVAALTRQLAGDVKDTVSKIELHAATGSWDACADSCDSLVERLRRYSKDFTRSVSV
jgi:hypothetical protein